MALPEIIKDIEARIIRPTSTDNAIVRFDGTTGQVQNSTPLIDDNGKITAPRMIHSNSVSTDTSLSRIPTETEIAFETGNNDGSQSAWLWRENWTSANYGVFHDNSADVIHVVGGGVSKFQINLSNGNTGIHGSLTVDGDTQIEGSVTSPKFIGTLQGNADTATKATQDGNGATISSTYLKLTGGTMSGCIYSNSGTGFVQQMNDTSNWRNAIAWRNATPETLTYYSGVGRHNTGGNASYPGVITILPYATSTSPWGRAVGLSVSKDNVMFENYKVIDSTGKVYGAIWNDYAEFRTQTEEIKPGYCAVSSNSGKLNKTTSRLQACDGIVSDTFGFAIGETDDCKTPLAVAGRVLAYCEGDRYSYNAGDAVCATANGLISKMTREEIKEYPDRIVGVVSEIPEYETWGTGNVKVDGRIWIKVR